MYYVISLLIRRLKCSSNDASLGLDAFIPCIIIKECRFFVKFATYFYNLIATQVSIFMIVLCSQVEARLRRDERDLSLPLLKFEYFYVASFELRESINLI